MPPGPLPSVSPGGQAGAQGAGAILSPSGRHPARVPSGPQAGLPPGGKAILHPGLNVSVQKHSQAALLVLICAKCGTCVVTEKWTIYEIGLKRLV